MVGSSIPSQCVGVYRIAAELPNELWRKPQITTREFLGPYRQMIPLGENGKMMKKKKKNEKKQKCCGCTLLYFALGMENGDKIRMWSYTGCIIIITIRCKHGNIFAKAKKTEGVQQEKESTFLDAI